MTYAYYVDATCETQCFADLVAHHGPVFVRLHPGRALSAGLMCRVVKIAETQRPGHGWDRTMVVELPNGELLTRDLYGCTIPVLLPIN